MSEKDSQPPTRGVAGRLDSLVLRGIPDPTDVHVDADLDPADALRPEMRERVFS
jgi:hypothetical protein